VDVGRLYLVSGADLVDAPREIDLLDSSVIFDGEAANDHMGHRLGTGGDMDGDGLNDFLTGAYGSDDAGANAGLGYVVFGASLSPGTTVNMGDADLKIDGMSPGDEVGIYARMVGDVDGDGLDDGVWASRGNTQGGEFAGATYLFTGSDLVAGSARRPMGQATHVFLGQEGDECCILSYAGDADGDGRADLLFGAEENSDNGEGAGIVYVVLASGLNAQGTHSLGTDSDHFIHGGNPLDHAGEIVNFVGDIDADGRDEIAVTSGNWTPPGGPQEAGLVSLFFSLTAPSMAVSDADYGFTGTYPLEHAGTHSCPAGDVNGDGRTDLIIGAVGEFEDGTTAGSVYLLVTE
jgi:hypothetical protein